MPTLCEQLPYDRKKAVEYANYWAYRRNPQYLDFSGLGGNCTNFVSQCLFAGSGVMNFTPTYGWYYITSEDRTASWTGVNYLFDFLTQNQGDGPYGSQVGLEEIMPGDVAQFANAEKTFYHTVLITQVAQPRSYAGVLVAAHSNDANCRPLDTYPFYSVRFIHIEGVRRCPKETMSEHQVPENAEGDSASQQENTPNPPSAFHRPIF